jgi:N-glycosylase/DNA lyase
MYGPKGSEANSSRKEDLWLEFNNHFRRKDRTKTPINHHDFLLANKTQSEYNMASLLQGERTMDAADNLLFRDRILRAHRNYEKL